MSNHICEELVIEIFSRLPSKSLLRFRSVSKSLRACINSPAFIRFHTLRSPKKFMVIHHSWRYGVKDMYTLHSESYTNFYVGITPVEYPFVSYYEIVGSCNGIMCVDTYGHGIILWNPSIRHKVIVQNPPYHRSNNTYNVFGFGLDPISDDYKILWINKPTSFVYTTGTWRKISSPTPPFDYVTSLHCLFNGALHCAVKRDSTNDIWHIIKFDLSSEVFSTIELPEPSWKTGVVTTIDNRLAVISSKSIGSRVWGVWVMRECNSWSVAFKLDTYAFNNVKRVFQVTTSDDLLLHDPYNSILVYNPKTNMESKLADLNDSSLPSSVAMCIESLGLLDIGTPC